MLKYMRLTNSSGSKQILNGNIICRFFSNDASSSFTKFKSKVVFILGGPGCGKGTQCQKIVHRFPHFTHLSAGELLRKEQHNSNSSLGGEISRHMLRGSIVPARAIKERSTSNKICHFLIDGFPRNEDNLFTWLALMGDKTQIEFVLHLQTSQDVCVARCRHRAVTSGRMDDNEDTLCRRLEQFKRECEPVIHYFQRHNVVYTVDASGTPEEVFTKLEPLFGDVVERTPTS